MSMTLPFIRMAEKCVPHACFHFEPLADGQAADLGDRDGADRDQLLQQRDVGGGRRVDVGRVQDARLVAGAVECTPRRLTEVENALRGMARNEQTGEQVAALATRDAEPLNYNHFKVPLVANLVKRAVRGQA